MLDKYYEYVVRNLNELCKTQSTNLEDAANMIFDALRNSGRFLVTGTGHSHMFAEEFYVRAGGFAHVNPILPGEFLLHEHPLKSTEVERIEQYAGVIMRLYKISSKDVLVIASNSGKKRHDGGACKARKGIRNKSHSVYESAPPGVVKNPGTAAGNTCMSMRIS